MKSKFNLKPLFLLPIDNGMASIARGESKSFWVATIERCLGNQDNQVRSLPP